MVIKNGKIYSVTNLDTQTSEELFFQSNGETERMFYKSPEGVFFSVCDQSDRLNIWTETEVFDQYLNWVGLDNYNPNDEINDALPNLFQYFTDLVECDARGVIWK